MANIIEDIQKNVRLVREKMMPIYREIGPAGAIGLMLLDQQCSEAESAIASGDIVQMVRACKGLQETVENGF